MTASISTEDLQSLREMIAKLQVIRSKLNLQKRECGGCGLKHYVNKSDWHMADKLDGARGRLIKIIEEQTSPRATQGDDNGEAEARD